MGVKRDDMDVITEEQKISFLKKIVTILNKNDVEYWLEFGTLLGYMRNNKFIPWDLDIDIAMLDSNIDKIKKLEKDFNKENMDIQFETKNSNYFSPHITIRDKNISKETGFHGDISFFSIKNDELIYMFLQRTNVFVRGADVIHHALNKDIVKQGTMSIKTMEILSGISKIPIIRKKMCSVLLKFDLIFANKRIFIFEKIKTKKVETKKANFCGVTIRIPKNAINHLLLSYGKRWKIPNKNAHGIGEEFEIKSKRGITTCKIMN